MLAQFHHWNIAKSNWRRRCSFVVLFLFSFLITISPVLAEPSTPSFTVVDSNGGVALPAEAVANPTAAEAVRQQLNSEIIKPEVSVPADGGVISGRNLLIKGVATPNVGIDLVIGATSGVFTPIMGKTTSDKYGVWAYSLGPSLTAGQYTLQVTATGIDGITQGSKTVHFTVFDASTADNNGMGTVASGLVSTGLGGNNLLIIIIAVISSITFLVTVVVLSFSSSARARKTEYGTRLKAWTLPEILDLSDSEWKVFIKQIEMLRNVSDTNSKLESLTDETKHREPKLKHKGK